MRKLLNQERARYHAPVLVCLLAIVVLLLLPTGFEGALDYQQAERCTACLLYTSPDAGGLGGDEGTHLGHEHDEGHLTHVGGLAGHVGACLLYTSDRGRSAWSRRRPPRH